MDKLPEYFHRKRNDTDEPDGLLPIDALALKYNASEQNFEIGGQALAVSKFDPYTFLPEIDLAAEPEQLEIDDIANQALILYGDRLIATPKLHDWVQEEPTDYDNVISIMHKAFITVAPDYDDIPAERNSGMFGFEAGNRHSNEKFRGISLQVFGNCACLGPSQYGLFVEHLENGWAEYELHNTDIQAQRASLYAGIGHLAFQATQS